ncbi:MAG: hypothetical protein Q8R67_04410 [Rhodoferax sp.]|nr:hypothetical protein [Rhodoferax sp.]MDP3650908.1 hypothetical protein [Rhodoferax sp.]
MKVIKPIVITPAMIVSSTAVNADADYNPATGYALNDKCTYVGVIWECIQGPATGKQPDTNPLYWSKQGPANASALFDDKISTPTTGSGSLTFVLKPGYVNSLALFGLVGDVLTVTARNGVAGEILYSKTQKLYTRIVTRLYEYLYERPAQLREVVLTGLPTRKDLHITLTVTGSAVSIGMLSVGSLVVIGTALYGMTLDLTDYSLNTTDKNGVTTFKKGLFSKRLSGIVVVNNALFTRVSRDLEALSGIPCVWIGTDKNGYTPLTIFGSFRNAPLTLENYATSTINFDIEGRT